MKQSGKFQREYQHLHKFVRGQFVANVSREQTRVIQNPFNIWYSILLKDKNLL